MSSESVGSDSIERLEGNVPLAPPHVAELRDVSGPAALGGGWRRGLELLYLMASTDFKRAYFGTALGYLWTIGRPLLLFGVLLVVFTKGLHLGDAVPHYPVLLLLNLVLFGFFTEGAGTALPSIVSAEAIVRKTQFPRSVIPVASVLTALFNLGLNLIVAFIFILMVGGITPMWTWLLLPVLVVLILVVTVAMAMILSSLYPRFRDVGMIWAVISTALFYATPVIYVLDRFSLPLRKVLSCNPLAVILELARKWIIDPHAPGPAQAVNSRPFLIIPAAIFLAVCVLAVWVFRREAPRIAEAL
jgi:ABC-2 type transport system permease protein